MESYKAGLVTKDFSQKKKRSNDYKETFSLILLKDSFKNIMALVVYFNLELHQMDIKIIFLNGDINETIYMVQ